MGELGGIALAAGGVVTARVADAAPMSGNGLTAARAAAARMADAPPVVGKGLVVDMRSPRRPGRRVMPA
jgi:hypothetical protein